MKKSLISFTILLYLIEVLFCLGAFITSVDLSFLIYIAFGLAVIAFLLGIFVIIKSILNPPTAKPFTFVRSIKLALIPFYVVNFVIGVLLALGSLIAVIFLPLMIAIVIVQVMFTYFSIIVTSAQNIIYFRKKIKEYDFISVVIILVLHIIFVMDIVASVLVSNERFPKILTPIIN